MYFSAYQKQSGDELPTAEDNQPRGTNDTFMREHRLYQVDFLLRRYGFSDSEIVFEQGGNLSLQQDPKEVWAQSHPERFPVDVNKASKWELLHVPGLGHVTVGRILEIRKQGRIRRIEDIGKAGSRLSKAGKYLAF